ncbi:MAG: hypothetical protein ACLFRH_09580 [Halothiobacillaceae bacterium]
MIFETEDRAGPEGPLLRPVFSVMVGGHRRQRLERNWLGRGDAELRARNLRETLLHVLKSLHERASLAFGRATDVYGQVRPQMRLLTGQASGTDRLAIGLAGEAGYALHVLLPHDADECPDCDPETFVQIERGVSMGMPRLDVHGQEDERAFRFRDDLALHFSDVLVAVWDGREPEALLDSGTAAMIRDALLRRQPVVLLQLDADRDWPRVRVVDPAALTDAWLMELRVLDPDAQMLLDVFRDPDHGALGACLDMWIEGILLPFEPARNPQTEENRLLARIRAQRSVSVYLFQWAAWLLSALGLLAARPRPLNVWAWLKGIWLWLRVMLDPPSRSQPLRVFEILGDRPVSHRWQEDLLHRLHGFFSQLARLSPRQALRALRGPARPNRYEDIRPGPAIRAVHPIEEPAFEAAFNWSDALAIRYGRRYRDDTWIIYYAAAFAVFCAVAGAIHLWPAAKEGIPTFWIFLEFILLHFIVRRVLKARFRDDHGHWISFRFIAEQLRYLRFGYPLLVVPSVFSQPNWHPDPEATANHPMRLQSAELWILQRMMVAEGLPRGRDGARVYHMSRHVGGTLEYINEVLTEHQQYFRRSFQNLHRDHRYLHRLAFGLFTLTFLAVTLHFFFYLSWILIFTAFFPAWGAAIHGILAQNEVVRVSAMSGQVWHKLTDLREAFALHQVLRAREPASVAHRWRQTQDLRELVAAASDILSDQNRYWRSLLQHNETNLPG